MVAKYVSSAPVLTHTLCVMELFHCSRFRSDATLSMAAFEMMRVQVTVAVQEPDLLDLAALRATLPRGRAEVTAVHGGLNVPSGDETIVIAQASVEAFLPKQSGWSLKD